MRTKYKRVLLKLSGESLMGQQGYGIDTERLAQYASQIKEMVDNGVETGIVIGGGNIFRGLSGAAERLRPRQRRPDGHARHSHQLTRSQLGPRIYRPAGTCAHRHRYVPHRRALRQPPRHRDSPPRRGSHHLVRHRQPVLHNRHRLGPAGHRNRGRRHAQGSRVDGIYTADPEKDPTATKFDEITYDEIYNRGLKVMDLTATALCKENKMPIVVFNMDKPGNLAKVVAGEPVGTLVYQQ